MLPTASTRVSITSVPPSTSPDIAASSESRNKPKSAIAASTAVAIAMPLQIAMMVLSIAFRRVLADHFEHESRR